MHFETGITQFFRFSSKLTITNLKIISFSTINKKDNA